MGSVLQKRLYKEVNDYLRGLGVTIGGIKGVKTLEEPNTQEGKEL